MLPPSLKHLLNPEEQHDGLAHPSQDAQGSAEALHPQHLTFAEKYGRLSSCDQTMWAFIEEAAARAHPLAEQKREYEHLHRRFNDLESYRLRCSQHFSVLAKRHNAFHRRMQEQDNKYQTTTATRTAALQKHVEISHQLQEFDFQLALSRIHGAMHEAQQDSIGSTIDIQREKLLYLQQAEARTICELDEEIQQIMRKMRELFAHDVQVHNALDNQADLCYALFNESSSMSEKARTLWDELVHTERQLLDLIPELIHAVKNSQADRASVVPSTAPYARKK